MFASTAPFFPLSKKGWLSGIWNEMLLEYEVTDIWELENSTDVWLLEDGSGSRLLEAS